MSVPLWVSPPRVALWTIHLHSIHTYLHQPTCHILSTRQFHTLACCIIHTWHLIHILPLPRCCPNPRHVSELGQRKHSPLGASASDQTEGILSKVSDAPYPLANVPISRVFHPSKWIAARIHHEQTESGCADCCAKWSVPWVLGASCADLGFVIDLPFP